MACGKPCTTTDAPGCRDAIEHEQTGLLVPVRDAKALARAIRQLVENPEQRKRMGEARRKRAQQVFSHSHINEITLKIYGELMR